MNFPLLLTLTPPSLIFFPPAFLIHAEDTQQEEASLAEKNDKIQLCGFYLWRTKILNLTTVVII